MKCISFSLYGWFDRYKVGAIKNAILASRYFPFDDGFVVRIYMSESLRDDQELVSTLRLFKGLQIVFVDQPENHTAKLWRYRAFSDSEFEAVIVRDIDARLSYRDRVAHEDWVQSGLDAHIIKDHPTGHNYLISAGMFAAKSEVLKDISDLMLENEASDYYTTDQDFLATHIHPRIKDSVLVHDPYYETPVEGNSIRTTIAFDAPTPVSHIGAALNADDTFFFDIDRKAQMAYCGSERYQYESDRWGK